MAMKFDFIAIEKAGGRRMPSSLAIGAPTPLRIPTHTDFYCEIAFRGFIDRTLKGYGADPFQAVVLSLEIARMNLAGYQREWDFHFGEDGPSTFGWPHSA